MKITITIGTVLLLLVLSAMTLIQNRSLQHQLKERDLQFSEFRDAFNLAFKVLNSSKANSEAISYRALKAGQLQETETRLAQSLASFYRYYAPIANTTEEHRALDAVVNVARQSPEPTLSEAISSAK